MFRSCNIYTLLFEEECKKVVLLAIRFATFPLECLIDLSFENKVKITFIPKRSWKDEIFFVFISLLNILQQGRKERWGRQ